MSICQSYLQQLWRAVVVVREGEGGGSKTRCSGCLMRGEQRDELAAIG
jgi:hypothetical protein